MLRALVATAVLLVAATANAQPGPHYAAPAPAPAYGAPVVVARPIGIRQQDRDLLRLAAEYDAAAARRDVRSMRFIEERVKFELRAELRDPGHTRSELSVLRELESLAGRFDRRAIRAKRNLIEEAVKLARFEGFDRDGRGFGHGRRFDDGRPGRG